MTSPPDINPYTVLGVQKDATVPEIKAAHRKLVLKCHPDKIQDESLRSKAQDDFQQVQQAYELLSDPARRIKYDQKSRLAELRREKMERSADSTPFAYPSPRTSSNTRWESRDGRIYEERTPADTNYFDEEFRFAEEPRPMSRKNDDLGRRRTKGLDEKRQSRSTPLNTFFAARETARENARATHSSRAKYRTKERKREAYEKYERAAAYDDLSDPASDSSETPIYMPPRRHFESTRRAESSSSRRAKTKESSRRYDFRDYDDQYSDDYESKHDYLHTEARDYILRSRGSVPVEIDSRNRGSESPMRHRGYESAGPDSSSRRPGRSARSSRDTASPSKSRSDSYENLDSPRSPRPKVPSMPTAATSMGVKGPPPVRPPPQFTRSATSTAVYSRSKRDGSARAESSLHNMVYGDSIPPRSSKRRDRYDSGYSSPNTPEVPIGTSSPKTTSTRYKIVTEEPDTVLIDPDKPSSRRQSVPSPPRQERPSLSRTASKPVRSSTCAYPSDSAARYEFKPPSASRTSSSRRLFGEVEYSPRPRSKDIKYAREIGPEHVSYTHDIYPRSHYADSRPPVSRRQTACN